MCRRFNRETITGVAVEELQADELYTFIGSKSSPTWVFAAIEVWSRLWPSTVVGRRSYRNTLALIRDVSSRMDFLKFPLIVTDGFDFYEKVVRRVFGPAALYSQVLKTRRNNRIVKVERRELMGASWRFEEVLNNSEDSSTLNTSFIERMNLTIRQGSAYLSRRTLSHARSEEKLEEHLELQRCHYNFVRLHSALKFGRETGLRRCRPDSPPATHFPRGIRVSAPILISKHRRDHVRRAEPAADTPIVDELLAA